MGSLCWGLHLHTALLLLINTDPCRAAATHSTANLSVSVGEKVHLFCNDSISNLTQIIWRKNHTILFTYSKNNQTQNNCLSDRVCIDLNELRDLRISSVQMPDEGIYSCTITNDRGTYTKEWRISVNDTKNEMKIIKYVAPAAAGVTVIVGICCALICYRVLKNKPNRSCPDTENTEGTDTGRPRAQRVTGHQYIERINSVYGT